MTSPPIKYRASRLDRALAIVGAIPCLVALGDVPALPVVSAIVGLLLIARINDPPHSFARCDPVLRKALWALGIALVVTIGDSWWALKDERPSLASVVGTAWRRPFLTPGESDPDYDPDY